MVNTWLKLFQRIMVWGTEDSAVYQRSRCMVSTEFILSNFYLVYFVQGLDSTGWVISFVIVPSSKAAAFRFLFVCCLSSWRMGQTSVINWSHAAIICQSDLNHSLNTLVASRCLLFSFEGNIWKQSSSFIVAIGYVYRL